MGSQTNFKKIVNFVRAVIRAFKLGCDKTRVAAAVFSYQTFVLFNFQTYCHKQNVDQALSSAQFQGSSWPGVYIGQGLVAAQHYLFGCSDRPHVPRVLLVVAAGTSLDDVRSPAMAINYSGVKTFCVGVGNQYSEWQLQAMASQPHNEHIVRAGYEQLGNTAMQVVAKILKGQILITEQILMTEAEGISRLLYFYAFID